MGFHASAAVKREVVLGASWVYPGGKTAAILKTFKHVVVDFNAWYRSFHYDGATTPRMAVHRFWDSFLRNIKAETVTICFDDYARNNEMRLVHYAKEAAKTADKRDAPGYVFVEDPPSSYQATVEAFQQADEEDEVPRRAEEEEPRRAEEEVPSGRVYRVGEEPMPDADVELMTEDHMPTPWPRMWSSGAGKRKMYRLAAKLLKGIVVKGSKADSDTQYIIHDMDGGIWTNLQVPGAHSTMPTVHYGEGDLKALMWALHHSRTGDKTMIVTIDWDAAFTLMVYDGPLHILVNRCYVHKFDEDSPGFEYETESVGLVKNSAKKKFSGSYVPAFEILHMPRFFAQLGGCSFDERLVYIMAILAFKGCDYCSGLNPFGYSEAVYQEVLPKVHKVEPWLASFFRRSDPHRRILRFYPDRYLYFLRHVRPNTPRGGMPTLEKFNKEVHNMLWTIRYITQFDAQRKPAGPRLPDYTIDLFSGAETIEEAIFDSSLEHFFDTGRPYIDFVEEFPTYNPVSCLGYPPRQAEALFGDALDPRACKRRRRESP